MLLFVIVFIMGGGQALLTSAGSVWLLFVDVFIVGVMFGALHGGKGGEAQCSPRVRSAFVQRKWPYKRAPLIRGGLFSFLKWSFVVLIILGVSEFSYKFLVGLYC